MKKTFHIITFGCQMNKSDSERIASYLEAYGFKNEPERKKAGVVIAVTCGIRQSAEDRNYGLLPGIKKENPKTIIVLTGCLSKRKDVQRRLKDSVDIWLNIDELPELHKYLGLPKKKFAKKEYLSIEPEVVSPFSVFIPIGNGCNNFCSYCVVPYARGREKYRSAEEVITEVEKFIKKGYKEIILIAQNVNSYHDPKDDTRFPELLGRVAGLPGNFWIRFSSSHPKDISKELIEVIAGNPKVCHYMHFAVQSGDNEILRLMNRKYTVEQYKEKVKMIRKLIPDVSLSTDVIVGFPGETKKRFENTVKLFREIGYDMVYISRFSSRPGTVAARMKDGVSSIEKKRRENVLLGILKESNFRNNKKLIGKQVLVLISGRKKNGLWFGKNEQDKVVTINKTEGLDNLLGKFVLVKIERIHNSGLAGSLK